MRSTSDEQTLLTDFARLHLSSERKICILLWLEYKPLRILYANRIYTKVKADIIDEKLSRYLVGGCKRSGLGTILPQ